MENPFIKIEDLYKNFYKDKNVVRVLSGLNLEIFNGEMLAIIGASGVGKTTLLNLIGTIDKPTSGKIYYGNEDISRLTRDELSIFRNKTIGYIFQAYHLIGELTALENVILPTLITNKNDKKTSAYANELLERLNLQDRIHHKPSELSGGEKQRVAIARALINNPKIILADEPTGNLDTDTANNIFELLMEFNKELQITTIVVTHNERLVNRINRAIRLEHGRAVENVHLT
jgi:ABC-type lipoprotein export system ATPase subunit